MPVAPRTWWDVRPHPTFGTLELRRHDGKHLTGGKTKRHKKIGRRTCLAADLRPKDTVVRI
jgi:hypothetical protein